MVNNVARTPRIDKQGRLIIPAEIRKKLSLDEGSVIEIKLIADQLILRKIGIVSKDYVKMWKKNMMERLIPIMAENNESESDKWYGEEYGANKLGL